MSASLVGSEMCIRDRHPSDAGKSLRANRAAFERLRAPRSARAFRVGPVSYTHLTLPTICSV
eukprot:7965893-Alexandrium_andersonii.AAC.1